jgi:transaldolase
MQAIADLKVKLFADGADLATIASLSERPYIRGFTTNPSLMRKAGVKNYRAFARDALKLVDERPISFEIFSDETAEMERQAREIATWGPNVYVKIPVTNTRGASMGKLIRRLSGDGIPLNVTAILTLDQVEEVVDCLEPEVPSNVSVFAGRIADTGRDPLPILEAALQAMKIRPRSELIWASPRELLNIFQAAQIGCHIITVTNDILNKLALVGKDLNEYSLETVRMFFNDAAAAGYRLDPKQKRVAA